MDLYNLPEWLLDALNVLLMAAEAALVIFVLTVYFGFGLPGAIIILALLWAVLELYKRVRKLEK